MIKTCWKYILYDFITYMLMLMLAGYFMYLTRENIMIVLVGVALVIVASVNFHAFRLMTSKIRDSKVNR